SAEHEQRRRCGMEGEIAPVAVARRVQRPLPAEQAALSVLVHLSVAAAATAHCPSCSLRSPETPTAPTSLPSISRGTPPSTGTAPSSRRTRRPTPPPASASWNALVGRL